MFYGGFSLDMIVETMDSIICISHNRNSDLIGKSGNNTPDEFIELKENL